MSFRHLRGRKIRKRLSRFKVGFLGAGSNHVVVCCDKFERKQQNRVKGMTYSAVAVRVRRGGSLVGNFVRVKRNNVACEVSQRVY